jgi:hypothetical protein
MRAQVFRLDTSDLDDVRGLLREYAASLAFDLDFQDFDRELAGLPGAYDAPHGALLGARAGGAPSPAASRFDASTTSVVS